MSETNPCTICEKVGGGYLSFSDIHNFEKSTVIITICYHCIAKGLRWIVRQAEKEEAEMKKEMGND